MLGTAVFADFFNGGTPEIMSIAQMLPHAIASLDATVVHMPLCQ